MICVMPDETEIDIPDAWRYAVHPRRLGMAALASAAPAGDAVGGKELEAERERILAHSGTDPALAALARSGEPSRSTHSVTQPIRPAAWPDRATGSGWPIRRSMTSRRGRVGSCGEASRSRSSRPAARYT
jgi:hypothetical protein